MELQCLSNKITISFDKAMIKVDRMIFIECVCVGGLLYIGSQGRLFEGKLRPQSKVQGGAGHVETRQLPSQQRKEQMQRS